MFSLSLYLHLYEWPHEHVRMYVVMGAAKSMIIIKELKEVCSFHKYFRNLCDSVNYEHKC